MSPSSTTGDQLSAASTGLQAKPELTHVAVEWNHDSPLICCRFDPTGRFVFATGEDRTIQRFDLASGQKVAMVGHKSWVRDMAFMPDGQTMVSCGYEGQLIWWPTAAEQPQPIRTVDAHQGWVRSVSISPDGRWLASGGNDRMVRLWNPIDGQHIGDLSGHDSHVYCVRFHQDSKFLLTGDLSGWVRQWDPSTRSVLRRFDATHLHHDGVQDVDYGGVRTMSVSSKGRYLACGGLHKASNPFAGSRQPVVLLFDWESQALVRSMVLSKPTEGVVWQVKFHPNGFLVGCAGPFLVFWKPDQDHEFSKMALVNGVREMDMHPDGLRLATVHHDGQLFISRMAARAG